MFICRRSSLMARFAGALALACALGAMPAQAQSTSTKGTPSESLRGIELSKRIILTKLTEQEKSAQNPANSTEPFQTAVVRGVQDLSTPLQAATELKWQQVRSDGRWGTAVAIHSPGALGLQLGLRFNSLPEGAQVYVYALGGASVQKFADSEVIKAANAEGTAPSWWSPAIEGSTAVLTVVLPVGVLPDKASFAVPEVNHFYVVGASDKDLAKWSIFDQTRTLRITSGQGSGIVSGDYKAPGSSDWGSGVNCEIKDGALSDKGCTGKFPSGAQISFLFKPAEGYQFLSSSLCHGGQVEHVGDWADCTVTSKEDLAGFVIFVPNEPRLTVAVVGGLGNVTSDKAGINGKSIDCGSGGKAEVCEEKYKQGDEVELTATPVKGFIIDHWEGGSCGGSKSKTCTVTMIDHWSIRVVFRPNLGLTAAVQPDGSGELSGNITCHTKGFCTGVYAPGNIVRLTAIPAKGFVFNHWAGDDCNNKTEVICDVKMVDESKQVIAYFTAKPILTVKITGDPNYIGQRGGAVTGLGMLCGGSIIPCQAEYKVDQEVTLTVFAGYYGLESGGNYIFVGWGGACTGTAQTCTVKMNGAKHVEARFAPVYGITLDPGSGSVSVGNFRCGADKDAKTGTCALVTQSGKYGVRSKVIAGTSAQIATGCDPGFIFDNWYGQVGRDFTAGDGCRGSGSQVCGVTMTTHVVLTGSCCKEGFCPGQH